MRVRFYVAQLNHRKQLTYVIKRLHKFPRQDYVKQTIQPLVISRFSRNPSIAKLSDQSFWQNKVM